MLLKIDQVSKTFGKTKAVADVSLQIPHGQICGFLGPNGAGKTTLIRMIMDIYQPDSGHFVLDPKIAGDRKANIGYLAEERGIYTKTKVKETLCYFATLKGLSVSDARKNVSDLLERLEMGFSANEVIGKLSKGNQQKIQFIAAIVGKPSLLILDEPFSGLDPINANLLSKVIESLRDEGLSIVLSTHQMNLAETFCANIFLFHRGKLILEGGLQDIIKQRSGNQWVLELQGILPETELFQTTPHKGNKVLLTLSPDTSIKSVLAWLATQDVELHGLSPFRVPLSEIFIEEVNRFE